MIAPSFSGIGVSNLKYSWNSRYESLWTALCECCLAIIVDYREVLPGRVLLMDDHQTRQPWYQPDSRRRMNSGRRGFAGASAGL
jgi:hypothetical protein